MEASESTLAPLGASVTPFRRRGLIDERDLAALLARHEALAGLCDRLEACADALPHWPSPAEAESLCAGLEDLSAIGASPCDRLVGRESATPLATALLREIAARHLADAVHAQDLIAALRPEPDGAGSVQPETLGYMLRCFFAGRRQTLVFEELALLVLAQHRLSQVARTALVDSLCRRAA